LTLVEHGFPFQLETASAHTRKPNDG
jgi:hypothetical protein